MLEAVHRPAKLGENVQVRDLGGNCHQRSGQRSRAVEADASKTCAEEDVGYRFQKRVSSFSLLVSSVRRQRAMAAQALTFHAEAAVLAFWLRRGGHAPEP